MIRWQAEVRPVDCDTSVTSRVYFTVRPRDDGSDRSIEDEGALRLQSQSIKLYLGATFRQRRIFDGPGVSLNVITHISRLTVC